MSYIDTAYKEEKILMGLDDEAKFLKEDYNTFKAQCERFVNMPEMGLSYKLIKIIKTDAGERLGYCIHETEFIVMRNGEIAYKGNQVRTFYFVKRDNIWKVFKANTIETRTEIYKMECECNIYKKDDSQYLANLKVPIGSEYKMEYEAIKFTTLSPKDIMIEIANSKYKWENDILYLNDLKSESD